MNRCPQCGVELESSYQTCPLCNEPLTLKKNEKIVLQPVYPGQKRPLNTHEKLHLFWELAGILHFSGLVVTFLVDLILHGKPGWSLYTITGITASYVYITLLIFLTRKTFWFLAGLLANTLALLFVIDWLHNSISWFIIPGLPLAGFFILLLGLVMVFIRLTRQRGFNVIGVVSLAIGIYIMLIELSIEMTHGVPLKLSWSVIVAAAILPFSLILFYFHYRLKRGTNLQRFFHV
ncbi:MAG: zinc ribbon domain-containing protein [Bacteroidales bacterium]|nr:zinc ribbon domain-containing protein [Bacteroidales bacterium]